MFLVSITLISSIALGHAAHSQGYMCDVLNSSRSQIDEEICPTVVGGGVTAEDCQDALHMLVNEAEHLLRCPGRNTSGPGPTQAMKDAACVFVRKEEVNRTEIVDKICGQFNALLKGSCVTFFQNGWTLYEASCADTLDQSDAQSLLGAPSVESTTRFPGKSVVCSTLNNSAAEIEQEVCPGVVQGSEEITEQDCEDGLNFLLGEASNMLACPGHDTAATGAKQAARDTACVFVRHEEPNQADILHKVCSKFGTYFLNACTSFLQTAWTAFEDSCGDAAPPPRKNAVLV
jgi:hypothetical protein